MRNNKWLLLGSVFIIFSCTSTHIEKTKPLVQQPPVKKEEKPAPVTEEKKIETLKPVEYALLLPVNFSENFKPHDIENTDQELNIDQGSMAALQFYEGACIAVDSLQQQGVSSKLSLFDTAIDSMSLINIFYQQKVFSSDLIIAGFNSNFQLNAVTLAEKHFNKIILTQPSPGTVIKNLPDAIMAVPTISTQCQLMSSYMIDIYNDSEFIIVHQNIKKENDIASLFSKQLDSIGNLKDHISVIIHDFNYTDKGLDNLTKLLKQDKRNVVIITSSDEAFISPLLVSLNNLNMGNIIIAGLPTWENFESIDYGSLKNLQVIFFSTTYIDYSNERTKHFRSKFMDVYKTDPTLSAYQGFDLVYYTGKALSKNKEGFKEQLKENKIFPDNSFFKFKQLNPADGFENYNINILSIRDYSLVKLTK